MKYTFQTNQTLRLLSKLFVSAGVLLMMTRCNNKAPSQEGMVPLDSVSTFTIPPYLSEGQIIRVVLKPHPKVASLGGMRRVLWSSSDTSVAKIQANSSGLVAVVVGQAAGEATITTTLANDTTKKTTAKTEVVTKKVENVTLGFPGGIKPESGSSATFEAVLTPKDASIKEVIWSSSDTSVAQVVNVIRENGTNTPTTSTQGTVTLVNDTLRAYAQVTAGTKIGETQIAVTTKEGKKKAIKIVETRPQDGGRVLLSFYDVCSVRGRNRAEGDSRGPIADKTFPTATVVRTTGGSTNIDYRGNDTGSSSNYYLFFPNQILTIAKGAKFNLTIAQRAGRSWVYIDWNGDEDFAEAGEIIEPAFGPAQGAWAPGVQVAPPREITVPETIRITGKVRMRIITGDAWNYADVNDGSKHYVKRPDLPCNNITRIASIKDFVVNIKN